MKNKFHSKYVYFVINKKSIKDYFFCSLLVFESNHSILVQRSDEIIVELKYVVNNIFQNKNGVPEIS